ncbi:autotransporter domain-containing protein [Sphingomicrobium nitratireducens]|uniref:autotransporter domain-containing protein n=1 Tax=Sphingomicrobium nitratireducens TaxID=2964666 RepID=UPI00224018AE|nr:autotransporter domain-containing protein [Sphingomicrobium nitratireducens]
MTKTRLLAASLLATAAMMPQAAHAQRIDRIVAFGDSYADQGNAFEIIDAFGDIPASAKLAYPTGRFSGGTNYIDTLAQLLNVDVDNFAIGGALTDNTNTNAGLPGFATEWNVFLGGGGDVFPAPTVFPEVSGTFGENDLLAISIGGNDARFYQQNGGLLANAPLAGAVSAAYATAGLDALVAAGAQNISYLAGNTANLPEVQYQPDPAAAFAVRDAYYQAFDAQMRDTLAGYAANGVMVHYLDLNAVLGNLESNLAAFGFQGIACPPFLLDTICIADKSVANSYVVYGDQLHLTSAGFEVVAKYVAAQLQAPLSMTASSDLAIDNARQFGRVMTQRMDGTSPRDGDMAEGLKVYVGGDAMSRSIDMTQTQDPLKVRTAGVHGGIEYGFGNGVVGLMGRYSMPEAEYAEGYAEAEATSLQIGAFAGYAMGPAFVQAYAGWGTDDHEVEREGIIEDLARSAEMDGDHLVLGAKAGYLANVGKLRVGPVLALDYATVDVDGYTESGDPALNLNVDSIEYSSLRGAVGVELRGDFAGSGVQLRPHASLMLEKDLDGDGRVFSFSQTASPTIVNSFDVGETPDDLYGRISGGFSAQIFSSVRLDVAANATIDKTDGDETGASVALSFGF